MKNEDSILQGALNDVRSLYSPAKDPLSKIQLKISVGILKGMISVQQNVEKIGTSLAMNLQKRMKTKGR